MYILCIWRHVSALQCHAEGFPLGSTWPCCPPPASTDLFTVSIVLSLPECHMVEIIQCVAFADWLLSLSKMHLMFLHVFSWLDSSFLFSTDSYSIVWMDHSLFIHLLKDILVASKFWQLGIKQLKTCICMFLFQYKFLTPMGKYQEMWLLDLFFLTSLLEYNCFTMVC